MEWELSVRGVRYDESEPGLLIHHHLSLSDHVLETEVLDDSGQTTDETETHVYEGASLVPRGGPARRTLDRRQGSMSLRRARATPSMKYA